MKKLLAILLCAIICTSAISCSGGDSDPSESGGDNAQVQSVTNDVAVNDLLTTVVAAYPAESLPTIKYYRSTQTDESAEDYLDPGYAGVLFYDEFGCDTPALDALDSFAMAVPEGKRAFEIDIMKAASEADVEAVKAMLTERLARKDNGEIETYVPEEKPFIDATEIYNIGCYVILVTSSDNSIAKGAIEAALVG